jgi:hypothetical protein
MTADVATPPRASFLGLPTEVRLQIYSYLEGISHYHVDDLVTGDRPWHVGRFSYKRRCHAPDPKYPFLCARPAFCGWYKAEELCHQLPEPPEETQRRGIAGDAIRCTCRLIYEETKGSSLQKEDWIGVTVRHGYDARDMLQGMRTHERFLLVHLTIQYLSSPHHSIHQIVHYLRKHHWYLPNLRTLAVQAPQTLRKFSTREKGDPATGVFRPRHMWCTLWFLPVLAAIFEEREKAVEVVLEAWIVLRAGNISNTNDNNEDEMVRVRATWGEDAETWRRCMFNNSAFAACFLRGEGLNCEIESRGVNKSGGRWKSLGSSRWRSGPEWMEFWDAWGMGYHHSNYGGNGVVDGV